MAVTCTKPPCVIGHRSFSIARPNSIIGVKIIGSGSQFPWRRRRTAPLLQIKSSINNKVFEDQSEGIVCYIDDAGETVCEGYDEGPRFRRKDHNHQAGEVKIIGLLQRNWIQLVNTKDVYRTDAGSDLAAQEEFNQNGCNFN